MTWSRTKWPSRPPYVPTIVFTHSQHLPPDFQPLGRTTPRALVFMLIRFLVHCFKVLPTKRFQPLDNPNSSVPNSLWLPCFPVFFELFLLSLPKHPMLPSKTSCVQQYSSICLRQGLKTLFCACLRSHPQ